jgi:hypothetical protein
MHCVRARGRYLAALGLSGLHTALAAFGCHGAESATTLAPSPTAANTATVETGTASSDRVTGGLDPAPPTTGALTTPHTVPWVPSTASDPPVRSRPGIATCPHGPFCVPQPADPGQAPAPAPLQGCADTVPLPAGIGPDTTVSGRQPSVTFDAARTTTERVSDPTACCYQWNVLCVGGRVLRGPEGPVTAAPAYREDWLAPEAAVDATVLAPAARAALAAHWEREAAFEHASVGAYALASAYGGARRGPGPMPALRVTGDRSLATVAVDTFLDGCAGEATAALVLREAAATAEAGAMRVVLDRIAEDEERHAELAWRTVAWALRAGGEEVARRLIEATATLRDELRVGSTEPAPGEDLSAHGVLGEAAQQAIRRRAISEVVIPCVEALLAVGRPELAAAGRSDSA